MTVFNCYMKIAKKNIGMIIMYFVIFIGISIAMLQVNKRDESNSVFNEYKLAVGLVDRDGSEVSKGVADYLSKLHNVELMNDNMSEIQESMYYFEKDIIVQIPEGFGDGFISKDVEIDITQQPGTYNYMYIESQINDFLNRAVIYNRAGYTVSESFKEASIIEDSKVSLLDVNGNGGRIPDFAYMFRYFPYISIAILCNVLGTIVFSFRTKEVKNRIAASAISFKRQWIEEFLAFIVIGGIIWIAFLVFTVICTGKSLIENANLPYYIINSMTVTILPLSIAFLIGMIAKKLSVVNMIVTPVSLFMSFLGGVFVPLSMLNDVIRKVARFIPVYWYEDINDKLINYEILPAAAVKEIWCGLGIQMLFIIMFIAVALAVNRYQKQAK